MKKQLLLDSIIYTVANILTKAISFIMIPVYTSFLSAKEYGVVDLLVVTGSIISVIIGLEIHQAVSRFFPESNNNDKITIVSTGFWSIVFLYGFFIVCTTPFYSKISFFLFDTLRSLSAKLNHCLSFFHSLLSFRTRFLFFMLRHEKSKLCAVANWQFTSQTLVTSLITLAGVRQRNHRFLTYLLVVHYDHCWS